MTGIPTAQVLLDDGTGTFPYDITSKARVGYQVSRGRQDELAAVTAGQLQNLTLDNTDGRFTVGSTVIASPSPIKADAKIRVVVTPGPNLLSADASSFETATGGWAFNTLLGARTLGTSLAQSAVRATDGTKCLLITWSTSASGNYAGVAVSCIVGQVYTFSVDVYVPSGSPNVRASTGFFGNSAFTSLKDQWVRLSVTWTATQATHNVGIDQVTSTAGQTCYVDSAMVSAGRPPTGAAPVFEAGVAGVNRFTGYTQSWPVEWPAGGDTLSEVTLTATDAQARAQRRPLKSVIEEEVLKDAPAAYYTLGDPAPAPSAVDSSGTQAASMVPAGAGTAVVFGTATGPGTDGLTAAQFAAGQYLTTSALAGVTVPAVACSFSSSTAPASGTALIVSVVPGADLISINTGGKLVGPLGLVSAATVTDGLTHVAEVQYSGTTVSLILDGSVVASTASALTGVTVSQIQIGQLYTGVVAHAAFFTANPGTTRAAAHSSAMLTGFAGESGTARIARTAGYANLPVGTLDTSLTNVPFEQLGGKSVVDALASIADAEFGLLFYDGSGNLTFHNRNRVVAKTTPDVTIDANYLDPGTKFTTDMQGVINYFEVTAAGTTNGSMVIKDATSETSHGRYPSSKTYLVQTDQEAIDRGNWIVATHKEPGPRAGTLIVDILAMPAALQAQMLAIEPNTWVQVTGLPSQTPGGTTANFIVQGFSDALGKDSWLLTLNVVDKATVYPTVWILDSSTLDSTTRLYV